MYAAQIRGKRWDSWKSKNSCGVEAKGNTNPSKEIKLERESRRRRSSKFADKTFKITKWIQWVAFLLRS